MVTKTNTALLNWGQGTTELELFQRRVMLILKNYQKDEKMKKEDKVGFSSPYV